MQYLYDGLGRVIQTTYNDGSTQQVQYMSGTDGSLVSATKDRNGVVTSNTYDDRNRLISSITAAAIDANILDGAAHDQPINDPLQQSLSSRTFYPGTNMLQTRTADGRTTEFVRDPMARVVETKRFPNANETIVSKVWYDGYRMMYSDCLLYTSPSPRD